MSFVILRIVLGVAISNFDEMRARLREPIQTQLKYEDDRKELVAGISHDLRTPLTAIKGSTNFLGINGLHRLHQL